MKKLFIRWLINELEKNPDFFTLIAKNIIKYNYYKKVFDKNMNIKASKKVKK